MPATCATCNGLNNYSRSVIRLRIRDSCRFPSDCHLRTDSWTVFFLDIRCSAAFLKFSCLAQLVFECTLTPRIIIILSSCLQRLQGSYVQISRTYSRVVSTVNNILVSGQKQEFCRRIYGSRRIAETPLWTLLGYVSRRETTRISLKIVLFLCSWKSK